MVWGGCADAIVFEVCVALGPFETLQLGCCCKRRSNPPHPMADLRCKGLEELCGLVALWRSYCGMCWPLGCNSSAYRGDWRTLFVDRNGWYPRHRPCNPPRSPVFRQTVLEVEGGREGEGGRT